MQITLHLWIRIQCADYPSLSVQITLHQVMWIRIQCVERGSGFTLRNPFTFAPNSDAGQTNCILSSFNNKTKIDTNKQQKQILNLIFHEAYLSAYQQLFLLLRE